VDIDEARRIAVAGQPLLFPHHQTFAALRAFEEYSTQALNTLADRDEEISGLRDTISQHEMTIENLQAELAEARRQTANRQAVIDGHGGAMRELRKNLLRDAEDIKAERDRLKCQVNSQNTNATTATQRNNERLKWLAQQAGITFPATWQTIQGHVSQAFADQARWKELTNKVTDLGKRRDGDRVTKLDLNVSVPPPSVGYTLRMNGTIAGPFRSYLTGDQEQL